MSDLYHRIADASDQVVSRWSADRADAAWAGVQRRQVQRARLRAAGAGLAALAVLLIVVMWRLSTPIPIANRDAPSVPSASTAEAPHLVLSDGSQVTRLSDDTRLTELERGPTATRLRLETGSAKFHVTHNPERVFEVRAREVRATVLGTVFTVELRPEAVVVAVEKGRVRLTWPEGSVTVGPGEQHLVPNAARSAVEPETPAAPPTASATAAPARPASLPDWRTLAERQEYRAAYDRLTTAGARGVNNEPGDLLLAADVMRLGGHPAESLVWLQRVVDDHPGDSRAPLAAFTLGRLYLDQLGRPAAAAQAFAQARRMAPGGALAEDSLAREVEAYSRAGDAGRAHLLAVQYLDRYPNGRRATAVRRFGGLP